MDAKNLTVTEEAKNGFYPTPKHLAELLLDGIRWEGVKEILEPSAGKGDLILAVGEKVWNKFYNRWGDLRHTVNVDGIEIDPNLRGVLLYEFGESRLNELYESGGDLRKLPAEIEEQVYARKSVHFRIAHDDFLKYDSRKKYDLIVMNPPFLNGDLHLLKAIQIQEQYGGMIRCILNAETILNPYSKQRKILADKLKEYNADVTFHDGAFLDAERKTSVQCAIVKINIPAPHRESTIYERLRKAADVAENPVESVQDLTVADFFERIVSQFNVEVDAGVELIREYEAMTPYILSSMDKNEPYNSSILHMSIDGNNAEEKILSVNNFIRAVRMKYWGALFSNKDFVGKLTHNVRKKYMELIREMADYDFTVFNIQQIAAEMNAEIGSGIQESIVALFDRMTEKHSWYPECERNVHYFNGWKTNTAHKIGSKVILPVNGMFGYYSWEKNEFDARKAEETIEDIEKVFDYLDGKMTASVDLHNVIQNAKQTGNTKNIQCKYFSVSIYKKGTMHLKFNNPELVDRFNIYCCGKKGWLPPRYGKTSYANMTADEKAVVDGFNGTGAEGSGQEKYAEVIRKAAYYLQEPGRTLPMLTDGA